MSLQRSGQRSLVGTERTGSCVHQLPCGAGCYVTIDLVQNARAISELAINRQDGVTVSCRNRRTVIRESRRPQPFFTDPKLLPDRDMTRVREMQVGGNSPLVGSGDSDWKLPKCRPVLPSDVTHQAEV